MLLVWPERHNMPLRFSEGDPALSTYCLFHDTLGLLFPGHAIPEGIELHAGGHMPSADHITLTLLPRQMKQ